MLLHRVPHPAPFQAKWEEAECAGIDPSAYDLSRKMGVVAAGSNRPVAGGENALTRNACKASKMKPAATKIARLRRLPRQMPLLGDWRPVRRRETIYLSPVLAFDFQTCLTGTKTAGEYRRTCPNISNRRLVCETLIDS